MKEGIEIKDLPEYPSLEYVVDKNIFIGEAELEKELKKIYLDNNKFLKPRGIENDVKNVAAISRLRRRTGITELNRCKAVLVSDNFYLSKAINISLKERFLIEREFPLVINTFNLTSLLWLTSFSESSNIATSILLANAYGASSLSGNVVDKLISEINKLTQKGEFQNEEALLIRQNIFMHDEETLDIIRDEETNITRENLEKMKIQLVDNKILQQQKERNARNLRTANREAEKKAEQVLKRRVLLARIGVYILCLLMFAVSIYGAVDNLQSWINILFFIVGVFGAGFTFICDLKEFKWIEKIIFRRRDYLLSKYLKKELELIKKYE